VVRFGKVVIIGSRAGKEDKHIIIGKGDALEMVNF